MNYTVAIFFLWFILSTVLCSNLVFDGFLEPLTTYSERSLKATSTKIPDIRNRGASNVTKSSIKKSRVRRSTFPTLLDDDLKISEDYSSTLPDNTVWSSTNTDFENRNLMSVDGPIDLNSETINLKTTGDISGRQEGSGDLDYLSSTMTDFIVAETSMQTSDTRTIETSSMIPPPSGDPSEEEELLSELCFDTMCNASQLSTGSKPKLIIRESTNITITCGSLLNNTYPDSLHWYFTNGTDLVFKDKSGDNNLDLVLNNAQKLDSGIYKCVKKSEQFCCSAAISIIVYERPNYNLHLVIIGGVTAGAFAICILVSILQQIQSRRHSRMEDTRKKQQPLLSL